MAKLLLGPFPEQNITQDLATFVKFCGQKSAKTFMLVQPF